MDVWLGHVSATLECLSAVKVQDNKQRYLLTCTVYVIDIHTLIFKSFDEILSQVDKWCSSFCHGVQVDDNNVIQQVHHNSIIIYDIKTNRLLNYTVH